MSYSFERYEYHYLIFEFYFFSKAIFAIDVGRSERLEQAHEVYKRMSDEYRNVDDRTVGVDEGKDVTKDLKGLWKGMLNR